MEEFKWWGWVTMQLSMRGAHKVSRQHIGKRSHHWKGRIVELKQTSDGKKLAKVQHVYKATHLKLANNEHQRYPSNCGSLGVYFKPYIRVLAICSHFKWGFADVFPSNFVEWEHVETLTGTFQAYHVDIRHMIYSRCSATKLLPRDILFYGHTYMVPKTANGWGKLEKAPAPSLTSPGWPIPDTTSMVLASGRIESDVKNAMKCTYGSHRATITCFMPIHIFACLFCTGDTHRTPTMWIAKGEGALCHFLSPTWDSKVVHHNGDTIKCSVIKANILVRYHIAKQHLSIMFPYSVSLQVVEAYKGRMGSFGLRRNVYRVSQASHIYEKQGGANHHC